MLGSQRVCGFRCGVQMVAVDRDSRPKASVYVTRSRRDCRLTVCRWRAREPGLARGRLFESFVARLRATNSAQDDSAAYTTLRSRVGRTVGLRGIIVSAVFVFVREFEIGFG